MGCCHTVHAWRGTFLMFLEILPGEEALSKPKPLWQVFSKACGGFLEPSGWLLLILGAF